MKKARPINLKATQAFRRWMKDLTAHEAAKILGCSPITVNAYMKGDRPPPRYILLACRAADAGLSPIG